MPNFVVNQEYVGQRADVFVAQNLPSLTRSFIKHLFDKELVLINDQHKKAGFKLRANDTVSILYDESKIEQPNKITLQILYEDDDCVVINKPVGILTHSKGAFNPEATVATWMQDYTEDPGGDRAGIVHRLDRATSGVMICAKNDEALTWLQKQFSSRKVKKTYVAVINGRIEPQQAIIDMPIERNPKKPQTFRAGENGKPAQTEYKVIKTNDRYSLLELKPQTGRTHQLRVHLKYLGHPIVGDNLYGGERAKRLYLHALALELTLPNRERRVFVAAIPPEFPAIMGDA